MSKESTVPLLRAALALRAAAPQDWAAFVHLLKQRGMENAVTTVAMPVDKMQVWQGRSIECLELAQALDKAAETLEKVEIKQRAKSNERFDYGSDWGG